jgi:hypothetical protein
MSELKYGSVYVHGGRFKGRMVYYDDDETSKTAICYLGHPLDFVRAYDIPVRFLREPTVDDLLKRREAIWRQLTKFAIDDDWIIEPLELHELWSEKSMIDAQLYERRTFGEFGRLESGKEVFLCHSSSDKGFVRMVHDDLKHLGVNLWLDENEIKVGESIVSRVSDGLESSRTLIVFLSSNSIKSMWARREWQSFLSRHLKRDDLKILPVLIESCEIPAVLADIKYADFRESYHEGFRQIYEALK